MHTSERSILTTRELYAYYDKAEILRDVNLDVKEGKITVILGPNGAGKTTLMKAICGLVKTRGKIIFDGVDITNLKTHERIRMGIAICPEGRRLFPNMSVRDNLLMGSVFVRDYEEQLEKVFSLFPRLKERLNQKAGTLSGGEQQMLAIARALMSKPKLLLLDEPSIGLAPIVVESIGEAISEINRELGVTVVLVEQNIHLGLDIADYAYILSEGRIKVEGKAEEIKEFEEIRRAYFSI